MNRRELIDHFQSTGFHPSHRMGQNFLVDRNLAEKLVGFAGVGPRSCAVEVGPGMGMITRAILETGARVRAIEKDERLLQYLQQALLPEYPERLILTLGDAVAHPLAGAEPASEQIVIANPPFAITGPWLAALLDQGFPATLAVLLQKEAVERLRANAGTKALGVLAIRLQAAYAARSTHAVPPQSFYPAPTIDSQIVILQRKPAPVTFPAGLLECMQFLFQQRRKQMGARLRSRLLPEQVQHWQTVLQGHGLSLQSRPEQVPLEAWIQLAGIWEDSSDPDYPNREGRS